MVAVYFKVATPVRRQTVGPIKYVKRKSNCDSKTAASEHFSYYYYSKVNSSISRRDVSW